MASDSASDLKDPFEAHISEYQRDLCKEFYMELILYSLSFLLFRLENQGTPQWILIIPR